MGTRVGTKPKGPGKTAPTIAPSFGVADRPSRVNLASIRHGDAPGASFLCTPAGRLGALARWSLSFRRRGSARGRRPFGKNKQACLRLWGSPPPSRQIHGARSPLTHPLPTHAYQHEPYRDVLGRGRPPADGGRGLSCWTVCALLGQRASTRPAARCWRCRRRSQAWGRGRQRPGRRLHRPEAGHGGARARPPQGRVARRGRAWPLEQQAGAGQRG